LPARKEVIATIIFKSETKKKTIANKHNLIEELISVWAWAHNDKIRNDCVELVHSMPARVEAVNKAKGSFTKYSRLLGLNKINVWVITQHCFGSNVL